MLNPVSEPLVQKVLPALRKLVAQKLHARGFTQSEIADMMELTQPAVSQYLNDLRGGLVESIQDDPDLDAVASDVAEAIASGDKQGVRKAYLTFCRIVIDRSDFHELLGYEREFFVEL